MILFSGGKDSIVMLHLAAQGVRPAPVPFALLHVDTGHNFPEVIDYRDRARRRSSGCGSSWPACRTASTTAGCASAPTAPATRCRPCRCSTRINGAPVRRGVRRRAPRRGEGPRQGAGLLPARRVRPVGPAPPAPRAVGPLQRPARAGRARARLPAVQLDRAGRLALHRARGHRAAGDLLRPRARGVPARRHVAGRRAPWGGPRTDEARRAPDGPLPHGRRHVLHRRRRVDRDARRPR